MLTFALTLLFIGTAIIALASLIDTGTRARRLIDGIETLPTHTPYVGPLYNRHGREVRHA